MLPTIMVIYFVQNKIESVKWSELPCLTVIFFDIQNMKKYTKNYIQPYPYNRIPAPKVEICPKSPALTVTNFSPCKNDLAKAQIKTNKTQQDNRMSNCPKSPILTVPPPKSQ
jgi:hypothetical protein